MAARLASCKGVQPSASCPMASEMTVSEFHDPRYWRGGSPRPGGGPAAPRQPLGGHVVEMVGGLHETPHIVEIGVFQRCDLILLGGELADRELMLKRMENYIKSVMEWTNENYPGLISAWDVVNEAAADDGGMRESLWYETIGDDYIAKAFEFARKYAPEGTKLFYNDYNSYMAGKQKDILAFLKPIAEAGNIDGMGMQTHINTGTSPALYMIALKKYHEELGVEIHITELDVGTQKNGDWEKTQGDYYRDFMQRLVELKKEGVPITSVTLWGLTDALSWRAGEFPLLFNADLSKKPAFDGMIEGATDPRS